MSAKRRYIPSPQAPETIALTEEELRLLVHEIVREEVAQAMVRLRTDLCQMLSSEITRQMRMQVAASQCRRG